MAQQQLKLLQRNPAVNAGGCERVPQFVRVCFHAGAFRDLLDDILKRVLSDLVERQRLDTAGESPIPPQMEN